ncbi:MAG: phage tail protein [bacterium]|nr:phage tail protein [bacterium]
MTLDEYVGSICLFAGSYTPENYFECDGRLISVTDYPLLFHIIGPQFGGDGTRTFRLPDLRGRVAIPSGQSTTGWFYPPGAVAGSEKYWVYILPENLPEHTHDASFQRQGLEKAVRSQIVESSFRVSGSLRCNSSDGNRGPYAGFPGTPTQHLSAAVWAGSANALMAADLVEDATVSGIRVETGFRPQDIPVDIDTPDHFGVKEFDNRALYLALRYLIRYNGMPPPRPNQETIAQDAE